MTFLFAAGVASVVLPIALGAAVVQRLLVGQHTLIRSAGRPAGGLVAGGVLGGGQRLLRAGARRRGGPLRAGGILWPRGRAGRRLRVRHGRAPVPAGVVVGAPRLADQPPAPPALDHLADRPGAADGLRHRACQRPAAAGHGWGHGLDRARRQSHGPAGWLAGPPVRLAGTRRHGRGAGVGVAARLGGGRAAGRRRRGCWPGGPSGRSAGGVPALAKSMGSTSGRTAMSIRTPKPSGRARPHETGGPEGRPAAGRPRRPRGGPRRRLPGGVKVAAFAGSAVIALLAIFLVTNRGGGLSRARAATRTKSATPAPAPPPRPSSSRPPMARSLTSPRPRGRPPCC